MELAEALAELKTKGKEKGKGWMVISIQYKEYVLPYAAGIQLMQSLENIQVLNSSYSSPSTITPADHGDFKFSPLSDTDYIAYQLSQLMQITFKQARDALQGIKNDE